MKSLADCKLYAFVDTAYLHGREPAAVARQLCDGGADIIQLRAKTSTAEEVRAMAEAILPVTRSAGVPLVVNDHLCVAREVGAEFCHLGQEDVAGVKMEDGRWKIGLSSHAPEQAMAAVKWGAGYIGVGPVFATGTKPSAKPVTLEYVRWAAEHVTIPWFAIGGVNLQTLDDVLAAGARRVCVVSAILNAPDVAKACAEFGRRLR